MNFSISEHYRFTENTHVRVLATCIMDDGIVNDRKRNGRTILWQAYMMTFLERCQIHKKSQREKKPTQNNTAGRLAFTMIQFSDPSIYYTFYLQYRGYTISF